MAASVVVLFSVVARLCYNVSLFGIQALSTSTGWNMWQEE